MTKPSPRLIIHASLASGIPCWVGKGLFCLHMPGVLAYRPSRPPENAASPAGHCGRDDRQQQGRTEGDLAYREQPGELRRLELVHERVGAGREPVQLGGGLVLAQVHHGLRPVDRVVAVLHRSHRGHPLPAAAAGTDAFMDVPF